MLKNNFYRPVVLRKVVHMLLDIFLNFVIFCILFCILRNCFIIATRQTLSKFYFRHFNYFNHCFMAFWSRSFLYPLLFVPLPLALCSFTPCSLFLYPLLFVPYTLLFFPFLLPIFPPSPNAQCTMHNPLSSAIAH